MTTTSSERAEQASPDAAREAARAAAEFPSIRQLPPGVVNKIAAGEVIERPASVVKELLENSVDAGATRVEVSIQKGGTDAIRISDDGCGIGGDQLELAVASHATSKIGNADDLFDVQTLGFRGEALASIAEISQLTIRSRIAGSSAGYELSVCGGHHSNLKPCASPPGTTVAVEQLFFNTPVRRKFLKTTQTEMSHISEAFTRIALANPQVHLTLRHNDRTLYDLPATTDWSTRIGDFFGDDILSNLIAVHSSESGITLSGYVVNPTQSRGHTRMQYLFLNGRHFRDRSLQHALGEAYRGLLLTGRQPIVFLNLQMPSDRVDVNVHPCKLEVRFQDAGRLYSQLLSMIRSKFLATDLTARQRLQSADDQAADTVGADAVGTDAVGAPRSEQMPLALQPNHQPVDWTRAPRQQTVQDQLRGPTNSASQPPSGWGVTGDGGSVAGAPFGPGSDDGSRLPQPQPMPRPAGPTTGGTLNQPDPNHLQEPAPAHPATAPRQLETAIQIHNRYLVTQTQDGMVVIDQHALHERIIYEQLRDKILNGKLESQKLLVPEPVQLAAAEAAVVLEAQQQLSQIGIHVEPFGGDTVLVQAYPAMLANHNPAEMLRHVVELLLDSDRQITHRDVVDELLHMISCKAAVKAGDQLSAEEITALIQHRELCQNSHHCPHGRPTSLVFSREELDKRFKRI